MVGFLYKPFSDGGLNPGGTSVLLGSGSYTSAAIYNSQGMLLENLARSPSTELGTKFYSKRPGSAFGGDLIVKATLSDGTVQSYTIPNGSQRYEGPIGDGNPGESSGGGGGGGGGGFPAGFAPGQTGYGFFPAYLGGQFPSAVTINYNPISPADYQFTDPIKFAKKYGSFNRKEIQRNFNLASDLALKELDVEMKGLERFAPQAAELKRSQINLDNTFNALEKRRVVEGALPGVTGQLEGQARRAEIYASGRIPDEVANAGLEYSTRSRAADVGTQGGFGGLSPATRNISDLLTAEQRVNLSKYGDDRLTQNIQAKKDLLLPPTEFSDAGSQIRVMPEVGAGRLTAQALSEINNLTTIPVTTGFQNQIQQEQFKTNLVQDTSKFNATNQLATDQFNANTLNDFALKKFDYDVGYANSVAGAAQVNSNTQVALDQQQKATDAFNEALKKAQESGQIGAIAQVIGGLISLLSTLGGVNLGEIFKTVLDKVTGGGSSKPSGGGSKPSGGGSAGDTGGNDVGDAGDVADTGGDDVGDAGDVADTGGDDVGDAGDVAEVGGGGGDLEIDEDGDGDTTNEEDVDTSSGDGPIDEGTSEDFGRRAPVRAEQQHFSQSTGVNFRSAFNTPEARQAAAQTGDGLQRVTGVYPQQMKGTVLKGYDVAGRAQYMAKDIAESNDTTIGSQFVNNVATVLEPLAIFDSKDKTALGKVRDAAQDVRFIASLTDKYNRGDTRGFINALADRLSQPVIDAIFKDPNDREGASAAYGAYKLFTNWGSYSPAQKGLAIASIGIKGFRYASDGKIDLAAKRIIDPVYAPDGSLSRPGLTVGQALGLFQAGYNVYSLVKNWDEASTLQKIAGTANTVANVASAAQKFGLLSSGSGGGAAAGAGAGSATAGGAAAGGAGGAAAGGEAAGLTAASALGIVAGVGTFALGAKQVYDGWGQGGKEGRKNGAIGGATAAVGYYAAAESAAAAGLGSGGNYYVAAAVFAVAVAGNSIKTGKHKDQVARDGMREFMVKNGVADKDFQLTLADGTLADIGIDGSGDRHSVTNPDLLTDEHKGKRSGQNKLSAYDVDYTNDLDYASALGGVTLTRLLAGGQARNVDQLGNQVANAALKNVGYNQQMTQENFDKVMANQRAFYSKAGIKNKQDAYELIQAGFDEGRWNEFDRSMMFKATDLMYDDTGYRQAQDIMVGRHRGMQVVSKDPPPASAVDKNPGEIMPGDKKPFPRPTFPGGDPLKPDSSADKGRQPALTPSQTEAIKNKNKDAGVQPVTRPTFDNTITAVKKVGENFLSADDAKKRNQERYKMRRQAAVDYASNLGNV